MQIIKSRRVFLSKITLLVSRPHLLLDLDLLKVEEERVTMLIAHGIKVIYTFIILRVLSTGANAWPQPTVRCATQLFSNRTEQTEVNYVPRLLEDCHTFRGY